MIFKVLTAAALALAASACMKPTYDHEVTFAEAGPFAKGYEEGYVNITCSTYAPRFSPVNRYNGKDGWGPTITCASKEGARFAPMESVGFGPGLPVLTFLRDGTLVLTCKEAGMEVMQSKENDLNYVCSPPD